MSDYNSVAEIEALAATGDTAKLLELRVPAKSGVGVGIHAYLEGLLDKANGRPSARENFVRALQEATRHNNRELAFSAHAQLVESDLSQLVSVDSEVLDELEVQALQLNPSARVKVSILRGWANAIAGEFLNAQNLIEPLLQTNDIAIRFNGDILLAYIQTTLGEIESAEITLDGLLRLLEHDERVALQMAVLVWFARLALLWGRTTVAADAANQAKRFADALNLRAEEAALYAALAETASHFGDPKTAVQYAEFAHDRAGKAWYVIDVERVRALADITLARAAFLQNNKAVARDLALRVASRENTPLPQRAVALSEAAVYTLLCVPSAAAEIIARARETIAQAVPVDAGDAVALSSADDILAFLAAANGEAYSGNLPRCKAFTKIIQARHGLVTLEVAGIAVAGARAGSRETSTFDTVIERLTQHGPRFEARLASAYATRFMQSHKTVQPPNVDLKLTMRESEILAYLADGLSNKEIAEHLVVSPRTVETHVERILVKLEVGSRSRAIAKAIRLGIVNFDQK